MISPVMASCVAVQRRRESCSEEEAKEEDDSVTETRRDTRATSDSVSGQHGPFSAIDRVRSLADPGA